MDLQDYREIIDRIDNELLRLFRERMEISRQIAMYKIEHDLPVYDGAREEAKLAVVGEKAGDMQSYAEALFTKLFELSRQYQDSFLNAEQE